MLTLKYKCIFIMFVHLFVPSVYYLMNENIKYNNTTNVYVLYGIKTWLCSTCTTIVAHHFINSIIISNYNVICEFVKVIIFLIVFDIWFYWIHRMFHTIPYLYINFHKIHHHAIDVSPFDALVSSPFEGLISSHLPGILLMNLLNVHIITLYIIMLFAHIIVFLNHSTYDARHLIHHTKFNYNYGASIYMDILMGTNY